MENLVAWILIAAISLPASFLLASGFLRCVLRLLNGGLPNGGLTKQCLTNRGLASGLVGGGTRRDVL